LVSRAWAVLSPTVPPRPFDRGFILPSSISPSEFLRSDSRSPPFRARVLLPGFRPSSRLHRCASTATKVTKPSLRSVLRRSQPLDGLLRASALQACSIPQPRPGPISFRVFSLAAATLPRRKEVPPRRQNSLAHRPKPMPTGAFFDLGVLIRVEQRSDDSAVSLATGRSPLRVSSPPGTVFLAFSSGLPRTLRP